MQDFHGNRFQANTLVGKTGNCTIKTDTHEIYGTKTVIAAYLKNTQTPLDLTLSKAADGYKGEIKDKAQDDNNLNNPAMLGKAVPDDYPF